MPDENDDALAAYQPGLITPDGQSRCAHVERSDPGVGVAGM